MKSLTQDIRYYQAILSYADKHGVTKAARRNREYNNFPMRPLGWKSPREALSLFLSCVTYDCQQIFG